VHRYFLKWARSGLFRELWRIAILVLNDNRLISDKLQVIDGSEVFVQHLPKSVAFVSPKYKPKRAIKFSLLIDSKGTPLSVILGTANEHDSNLLSNTLRSSLLKPQDAMSRELLGDKGYIGPRQEITAMINGLIGIFHPRKNQLGQLKASSMKKLQKHRWKVERTISWLKSLRRLKYCYERSFETFQSLLDLGCLMLSLKKVML
jgi:transposase